MIHLNLGCGANHLPNFVNVDVRHPADVIHDLESLPWPWETGSVEHIVAVHSLEHLGRDPAVFISIVKEMYRVCVHAARVEIVVPSPWHDDFVNDPTHVRPITPEMLALFSRPACDKFAEMGASNTPLAHIHGVDIRPETIEYVLDERFKGTPHGASLERMMTTQRNVVKEIRMAFVVVKEEPKEASGSDRLTIRLNDGQMEVGE